MCKLFSQFLKFCGFYITLKQIFLVQRDLISKLSLQSLFMILLSSQILRDACYFLIQPFNLIFLCWDLTISIRNLSLELSLMFLYGSNLFAQFFSFLPNFFLLNCEFLKLNL